MLVFAPDLHTIFSNFYCIENISTEVFKNNNNNNKNNTSNCNEGNDVPAGTEHNFTSSKTDIAHLTTTVRSNEEIRRMANACTQDRIEATDSPAH